MNEFTKGLIAGFVIGIIVLIPAIFMNMTGLAKLKKEAIDKGYAKKYIDGNTIKFKWKDDK